MGQNKTLDKNVYNFLKTNPFETGPKPFKRGGLWLQNGAGYIFLR